MADRAEITRRYRLGLTRRRSGLLALLAAMWRLMWDPADPLRSLVILGAFAGQATAVAQAQAVADARAYLLRLAGGRGGPFALPAGLIGATANGLPLNRLSALAPAIYAARLGSGWSAELSASSAAGWLNAYAASEPYRAANATVLAAASSDSRLTGRVLREARPGACPFCQEIANRGYWRGDAGFAAHANCQCTAAPEMR